MLEPFDIYTPLRNYQSTLVVYPTQVSAHEHFLASTVNPPPADLQDVDFLVQQLSAVRSNPTSRVPTAVKFITASTHPHTFRGFAAVVEIPALIRDFNTRRRWHDFQLDMERFRKGPPS